MGVISLEPQGPPLCHVINREDRLDLWVGSTTLSQAVGKLTFTQPDPYSKK